MELHGNGVSKGIAIGKTFSYQPYVPTIQEMTVSDEEIPQQINAYEQAQAAAQKELQEIVRQLENTASDKAKIFEAHLEMLEDEAVDELIRENIESENYTAAYAIHLGYTTYEKLLKKAKDALIAERAADLVDVKNRLLRCLEGKEEKNLSRLSEPVIVVAHDLLPSDTATMDQANVLGILTETGGATSHSAIIARSYGIPAILGIPNVLASIPSQSEIILDAFEGTVLVEPTSEQKEAYSQRRTAFLKKQEEDLRYRLLPGATSDGTSVDIGLNIGSADPLELQELDCADYIGLFRTEFLYMNSDHLPTEEEQFEAYRRVLVAAGDKPVTLRTLDIGGDKSLSYMELPKEDNPFLGKRALRLCFDEPDLFRAQIRAALRASAYGNLWLMFPMVGSLEDLLKAKTFVQEVHEELTGKGIAVGKYKIGIMIEIPSVALTADLIAPHCDFASIGSNDLTQYALAVDRMNPTLTSYYQSYHPALFRLMKAAIDGFTAVGKPISVCGELGGDPYAALALVGMGMRKLSMNARAVPEIKHMLSTHSLEQCEQAARLVCEQATAMDNETALHQLLD